MFTRKLFAGLVTTSVAMAGVVAMASPAHADPDDTTFTPVSADIIGVGSDTTQKVVKALADLYNAGTPTPTARIASYAATGGGSITLPDSSSITRPNGSGAGKGRLYGANNNNEVDFARSSSGLNSTEAADLTAFPFALDTQVMATASTSNAPANLTVAQLLAIYKGDVTNWSAVGGTPGTIVAKLPQTGSGSRTFFLDQLKAANGGTDPTIAGSVIQSAQENDPAEVTGNPNAIIPFSLGRAQLAGGSVRIETGYTAQRAVYNVVRDSAVSSAFVDTLFDVDGFFCSPAAKTVIEAQGFKQLFPQSKGGACGQPTQSSTTNLTVAEVQTSTTVTVTSASSSSAKIVAAVTGSTSPSGTVAFYEGATLLQSGVPLVSGQATRIQPATPGPHTYRAVFTPAGNSAFTTSEGTGTGSVQKATSSISEDYAKTVAAGKRAKGTVTVVLAGSSAKASGSVTIKEGNKVLVTKVLANGTVKIKLPKLSTGKHKLTIVWAGDANGSESSLVFKIKQLKKPKKN